MKTKMMRMMIKTMMIRMMMIKMMIKINRIKIKIRMTKTNQMINNQNNKVNSKIKNCQLSKFRNQNLLNSQVF
jgi:hypothetical protein